jgi:hypothetical protein
MMNKIRDMVRMAGLLDRIGRHKTADALDAMLTRLAAQGPESYADLPMFKATTSNWQDTQLGEDIGIFRQPGRAYRDDNAPDWADPIKRADPFDKDGYFAGQQKFLDSSRLQEYGQEAAKHERDLYRYQAWLLRNSKDPEKKSRMNLNMDPIGSGFGGFNPFEEVDQIDLSGLGSFGGNNSFF